MNKNYITSLFAAIILPFTALAIPGSTNSATVSFAGSPTADYGDWAWKLFAGNDTDYSITVSDSVATSNFTWQFRFVSNTGTVLTVANASITASGTAVTWSIADTNLPSAGSYRTELLATETSSGDVATAGQGKIMIKPSLF